MTVMVKWDNEYKFKEFLNSNDNKKPQILKILFSQWPENHDSTQFLKTYLAREPKQYLVREPNSDKTKSPMNSWDPPIAYILWGDTVTSYKSTSSPEVISASKNTSSVVWEPLWPALLFHALLTEQLRRDCPYLLLPFVLFSWACTSAAYVLS